MNEPIVKLWLLKADNDFKTGKDELASKNPATDTVCFHMQQCVEKYLKAFLVSRGEEISKTHNLAFILQRCVEVDQEFVKLRSSGADELTIYAVGTRYPDDFYMPTLKESKKALRIAKEIKKFVLNKLPGLRK